MKFSLQSYNKYLEYANFVVFLQAIKIDLSIGTNCFVRVLGVCSQKDGQKQSVTRCSRLPAKTRLIPPMRIRGNAWREYWEA